MFDLKTQKQKDELKSAKLEWRSQMRYKYGSDWKNQWRRATKPTIINN